MAGIMFKPKKTAWKNIFIAFCSFGSCLLIITSLSSDYWIYEMETWQYTPENGFHSNVTLSKQFLSHSGLWKICCSETSLREKNVFPILSAVLNISGGIFVILGKLVFQKQHLGLLLTSGVKFVLSGLMNVLGIIIYISTNPKLVKSGSSPYPQYGWSFSVAACAFLLDEFLGVFIVKTVVAEKHAKSKFEEKAESYRRKSSHNEPKLDYDCRRKSIILPPSIQLRQNFQRKMDKQALYVSENDSDNSSPEENGTQERKSLVGKSVNFRSLECQSEDECEIFEQGSDEDIPMLTTSQTYLSETHPQDNEDGDIVDDGSQYCNNGSAINTIPPPIQFGVSPSDRMFKPSSISSPHICHRRPMENIDHFLHTPEDASKYDRSYSKKALRTKVLISNVQHSTDSGNGYSNSSLPNDQEYNMVSKKSNSFHYGMRPMKSQSSKPCDCTNEPTNKRNPYCRPSSENYGRLENDTISNLSGRKIATPTTGRKLFANGCSAYNESIINSDNNITSV